MVISYIFFINISTLTNNHIRYQMFIWLFMSDEICSILLNIVSERN